MENQTILLGSIAHIYRSHIPYMAKEFEAYRIGSGQFEFLRVLYHKNGISQENHARALKVNKATSARAIQNLEKKVTCTGKEMKTTFELTGFTLLKKGRK